jgi:hypothetical protein
MGIARMVLGELLATTSTVLVIGALLAYWARRGAWKRRSGGSAGAIGAKVTLNTTPMTIIGVASPEFDGLRAGFAPDIYTPITMWPWVYGDESVVRSQSRPTTRFMPGARRTPAPPSLESRGRYTATGRTIR